VYGLRRKSLLIFIPKYHLKVRILQGDLQGWALLTSGHGCHAPPPKSSRFAQQTARVVAASPPQTIHHPPPAPFPSRMQGVIHLTDKQGVCKPPLRGPGDEQLEGPFVLAWRRGLEVVAEPAAGSEGRLEGTPGSREEAGAAAELAEQAPSQLCIVESASGRQLAAFRPLQRVWVQLSADGSRAHGPTLRMRLLDDSHPGAVEAARQEAAAGAGAAGAAGDLASLGCGRLPRPAAAGAAPARAAYRPPGIAPTAAATASTAAGSRPAVPPGFEPQAPPPAAVAAVQSVAEPASSAPASSAVASPAAPEAAAQSLAARLQGFLEQSG